ARDLNAAERWLNLADWFPGSSPETTFLQARLSRKLGRPLEMETWLQRAEAAGVSQQRLDLERLYAACQAGVPDAQQRMIRLLVSGEGESREICESYAFGSLLSGQSDQTQTVLQAWKEHFPDDPMAWYLAGRVLEFQGRPAEAQKEYETSLSLNPAFQNAAYSLGNLFLNQHQPDQAADCFRMGMPSRFPQAAQIGMARALRMAGDSQAAASLLRVVVSASRDDLRESYQRVGQTLRGLPAHVELGQLELASGNPEAALSLLEEALNASPADPEVRYARAVCLRDLGRTDEARSEMEQVAELRSKVKEVSQLLDRIREDSSNVDARFQVARLYADLGSASQAHYWLRSVLSLNPDYPGAAELMKQLRTESSSVEN
ncbi:MAG: tetratricopeptide repeat protein, partial [Planctomycetaceae bacterium]|nr:tetratricopeptide repeat protein [Planctomycetaceae bacterium]